MTPDDVPNVRPRVFVPDSGSSTLLEDVIHALVEDAARGPVCVHGGPGTGKSKACAYLRRVLPEDLRIAVLDEPTAAEIAAAQSPHRLVVYTSSSGTLGRLHLCYHLSDWVEDDWIEYLLKRRPDTCAPILRQLVDWSETDDHRVLRHPELCASIIERLIHDRHVDSLQEALLRVVADEVEARIGEESGLDPGLVFLRHWTKSTRRLPMTQWPTSSRWDGVPFPRLLQHGAVQFLAAADRLAKGVLGWELRRAWRRAWPDALVRATSQRVRERAPGTDRLRAWIKSADPRMTPNLASVLVRADPRWTPARGSLSNLSGATLRHVRWSSVRLEHVLLLCTDLTRADLRNASLSGSDASAARFRHARLSSACLEGTRFSDADLHGADLSSVDASGARFVRADLTSADLTRANLTGANLKRARIRGADLAGADLSDARLDGLALRLANLSGARFPGATMVRCDLEGVDLETREDEQRAIDFSRCNLSEALLTGSRMPGARFVSADLRNAGLADVQWSGVDLRGADLRGASFHLGSSRSGLIESGIASEGSRTGFYTDEADEKGFQAPEDIRKADLRGADLRDARIDGVDFYLVDLRGALYDAEQAQQLRQTRAIL